MKLYIKQKVFAIKDRFSIYDENQDVIFTCEGKIFSIGKKLNVFDSNNNHAAYIHQKVLALLPKYFINRNGQDIACVQRKLTFFRPSYDIAEFNWHVQGNFLAHEYTITQNGNVIIAVSKKWISWGDCYELNIADNVDLVDAVCAVLIIDADLFSERASVSVSSD